MWRGSGDLPPVATARLPHRSRAARLRRRPQPRVVPAEQPVFPPPRSDLEPPDWFESQSERESAGVFGDEEAKNLPKRR
uniref:Retrotransposon protein, putative, Ty1-copia subclass, expressed n=1 Tax=Oryza sativa subsp. japonica TaxID=39947 RepID=Q2QVB8_ORYSJ|nr:retrotransposon protein, putative, Ty1-copia subclass, expressed [Oryza sativa Japonica Group]